MNVVISQPMFFPWIGIFEQARLADLFVHYDDVQLPLGRSFMTRVQVKTAHGPAWLTLPVQRQGKQLIQDVRMDTNRNWRHSLRQTLHQHYARAPHHDQMMELVDHLFAYDGDSLSRFNILAFETICQYFGLSPKFRVSSQLGVGQSSTQKLLAIVRQLQGDCYITGHGAKNYLDHELFERMGIQVRYMDYQRAAYPQLHGPFDPHVTILDLIANVGRDGLAYIRSGTVDWRTFVHG